MESPKKGLFHQAIIEYNKPNLGHPQYELWLNYALSTNQRGQYLVDTLHEINPSLRGKRLLDIGSGYGGTCLAAARAGAHATGIDISETLIHLADVNHQDHPALEAVFHLMDVMDWEQVQTLGKFDVITCDNVIEHVAIPERLIAHLRRLLAQGGFAYLTVPNAFSIGQVRADCHYGLFGISLLDPWDATVYVRHALDQQSYDVSLYYPYPVYDSLFHKYGFQVRLLNSLKTSEKDVQALESEAGRLPDEFQAVLAAGVVPDTLKDKLARVLETYLEGFRTALSHYHLLPAGGDKDRLAQRLRRDYHEEVWYVVAVESWRSLRPLAPLPLLRKGLRTAKRMARRLVSHT